MFSFLCVHRIPIFFLFFCRQFFPCLIQTHILYPSYILDPCRISIAWALQSYIFLIPMFWKSYVPKEALNKEGRYCRTSDDGNEQLTWSLESVFPPIHMAKWSRETNSMAPISWQQLPLWLCTAYTVSGEIPAPGPSLKLTVTPSPLGSIHRPRSLVLIMARRAATFPSAKQRLPRCALGLRANIPPIHG